MQSPCLGPGAVLRANAAPEDTHLCGHVHYIGRRSGKAGVARCDAKRARKKLGDGRLPPVSKIILPADGVSYALPFRPD